MSFRRWRIAPTNKELSRSVAERFGIEGFAAHLLVSRGFRTDGSISDMLGLEDETTDFIDPFEIIDMDKAVNRIRRALDDFESAKESLKKCIQLNPDFDLAKELLSKLN